MLILFGKFCAYCQARWTQTFALGLDSFHNGVDASTAVLAHYFFAAFAVRIAERYLAIALTTAFHTVAVLAHSILTAVFPLFAVVAFKAIAAIGAAETALGRLAHRAEFAVVMQSHKA